MSLPTDDFVPLSTDETLYRLRVLKYMRALAIVQDESERALLSDLLVKEEARAQAVGWSSLAEWE